MGILKRKRSESEFSLSSSSTFSSPPRPGSSNFNFGGTDSTPIRYGVAPSHLPSRTLKRLRDNRLSEEQIHQNTLNLLYSAQQQHNHNPAAHSSQHPEQSLSSSTSTVSSHRQPSPSYSSGQRSLHAYFNIPTPTPSPAHANLLPPPIEKAALALANTQTNCEDCGTRISSTEDEDGMMDIDGYEDAAAVGEAGRCVACAKIVCGGCSVSNLGAERRCLVCAGRDRRDVRGWERRGVVAC
ncbi:hypothetical protein GE09DRAFT_1068936 [Coniochaeta sp. 2T2.1]|nr:hypothetical protein GE09DRAFT_1068936 [Coniochaeta sp. 2T2.1]